MPTVRCPVCGEPVEIPEDSMPGELVEHDCGAVLEIVRVNGSIQLRLFEDIGEDWGE